MKVTAKSEEPQLRTAHTPYTSVTLTVSAQSTSPRVQEQRELELALLPLLVEALSPKVGMQRLLKALRDAINPDAQFDFRKNKQ